MKNTYVSLCFILLTCCVGNKKTNSTILTDKLINQWEKATTDSINNIYERNKKSKTDTFELKLLSGYCGKIYQHKARQHFMGIIKTDTIFLNAKVTDFILVERTHESKMYFDIIYTQGSRSIILSFNYVLQRKDFVLNKKDIIDSKKFQQFIREVRILDLFKKENSNGEYYFGEVMVSFFSKDKVEVFPYLTFNFSNDIYKSYNDMVEKK
jgi:hypothetical protein